MTPGLIAVKLTAGAFRLLAIGATFSHEVPETGPITANTPSDTSLRNSSTDCWALSWSSSSLISILLPLTPPLAFTSSTPIAMPV